MRNVFFLFQTQIEPQGVGKFCDELEKEINNGCEQIHIMYNSPGGVVRIAVGLYNFLTALPCELISYNISTVDSSAMLLFLSGQKRFCTKNSRFFTHPICKELHYDQNVRSLQRECRELELDTQTSIEILSTKTKICKQEWQERIDREISILPEDAVKIGLVDRIQEPRILSGSPIHIITSPESGFAKHH